MKTFTLEKFSYYSFLFGLFMLACSLPFSNLFMSISQFVMLGAILISGNPIEKLKLFYTNKIALIVSSIFVLHLIGLLYTTDFKYGFEDIRKKIPILLIPILFTANPISTINLKRVLAANVTAVIIATLISFYILLGNTSRQILQPQNASIFISHIRFSLLISMAIFILTYFFKENRKTIARTGIAILILWLILFLFMLESGTGIVSTAITASILSIAAMLKIKNKALALTLLLGLTIGGSSLIYYFYLQEKHLRELPKINYSLLPTQTKNGNPYTIDTLNQETEDGKKIWLYYSDKELQQEWEKRSKLTYRGKDLRGNSLNFTLARFLTSKDLTKDSLGISRLSDKEVHAIEKGVPNANDMGLLKPLRRFRRIIWEMNGYKNGINPSGHSVIQRWEFWKAALGIIKDNPILGVGTGDVKIAFEKQYEKMHSPLTKEWRLRSHNQFLAIGTAFGTIGLIWFLLSIFYPLSFSQFRKNYLYISFLIIAILSMFVEDTLETQAGVTFFAFYNSLFLFLQKGSSHKDV